MTQGKWVMEADQKTFVKVVLEQSRTVPVLVDFWAPWCGPCRTLGPILEKLALEMQGRFVLVKIDSDRNPGLAKQFGVRGIPAVKLVMGGQVVDEFTGAQPESVIRQFLDRGIPSEADRFADQGMMYEEQGDARRALAAYEESLRCRSDHPEALLGMVRVLWEEGREEEARAVMTRLDAKTAEGPQAKALLARMAFATGGASLRALQQAVAAAPGDLAARLQLGKALVASGQHQEGMEQFLEIVRVDREFEEDIGRKSLIQVFDLLGPTSPLVATYRSRLASLLFR